MTAPGLSSTACVCLKYLPRLAEVVQFIRDLPVRHPDAILIGVDQRLDREIMNRVPAAQPSS
jgi:hypothetical protein